MFIAQTPPPAGIDLNFLIGQLIPLIGMIGGLGVTGVVLYTFLRSELASALAERIRSKIHRRGVGDATGEAIESGHVVELEQKVIEMQGQIAEMAERLDFAERLLAQKRERSLPGA